MGYKIEYDPEIGYKYPVKKERRFLTLRRCMAIALFSLSICICVHYKNTLADWLLPGDPQKTQTAFEELSKDIRGGESLADAVQAFCKQIMDDAKT